MLVSVPRPFGFSSASLVAASLALASLLVPWEACAGAPDGPPDDRIVASLDGAKDSQTQGNGAGASAAWLHNFDANSLVGVGLEHQSLSGAQWTFGSVSGSMSRGSGDMRYGVYADVHEGGGVDGPNAFHYSIVDCGVTGTYRHRFSLQLESRQIDVETTHGNLPKVALSYVLVPHLLASVSYAYSVGGNLGTRLATARIQWDGAQVNPLAGVAFGRAAPAALNLQTGMAQPNTLKEGYVGLSFPQPRGELTVLLDYLDLAGGERAMLTVIYLLRLGSASNTQR
jgi:hypothetical protein